MASNSCLIEQMASPSRKHRCDSPPYIYSNKSRCRPSLEARVDPIYGQRSAFPGLDDETCVSRDNGDVIDHEEIKALEQEATEIPNVLVAPKSEYNPTYDDDDLPDGYLSKYEDGAFISIFDESLRQDQRLRDREINILPELYDSFLLRYRKLRTKLQQKPPIDLVANLLSNHRTCVGPLNKDLAKWWIGHIKNIDPNPVQVASMDKSTVLRLLGLLAQGTVLKSGLRNKMSVSRWAWSLLARLPESGSLTSEEISVLRELGKKAVLLSTSLRKQTDWETGLQEVETVFDGNLEDDQIVDPINDQEKHPIQDLDEAELFDIESTSSTDAVDDEALEKTVEEDSSQSTQKLHRAGGDKILDSIQETINNLSNENLNNVKNIPPVDLSDTENEPDDLLTAKARALQHFCNISTEEGIKLEPEIIAAPTSDPTLSAMNWNTRATVDMILTIVGEEYGQRDLLEFRSNWENEI